MIATSNLRRRIYRYWSHKTIPFLPVIFLFLGLIVTSILAFYDYQVTQDRYKELAKEHLFHIGSDLERAFYKRVSITTALEAFVKIHADVDLDDPEQYETFKKNFEEFTESLDNQIDGVMSMQLSPGAIVTFITNPERNNKAIGHDLLIDDARRDQVLATIKRKTQIVAGPVNLIQGGEAIIARQAVFTKPGTFSNKRQIDAPWLDQVPDDFWGLSTVLINTKTLYREAGLDADDERFKCAIRGRHGLGEEGEVFWGDKEVFNNPLARVSVVLPDGSWILAIQLKQQLIFWRSLIIMISGMLGTGLLIYTTLAQRDKIAAIAGNQAKSEFLTNMSHELRTPMHAILSFSEMGIARVETASRDKLKLYLSTIHSSGMRLMKLLDNLLDLSKLESGQMSYDMKANDLQQILGIATTELSGKINTNEIKLTVASPQFSTIAVCDSEQILQVLRNLLSNAIKFTPKNRSIEISFEKVLIAGTTGIDIPVSGIAVIVSDEGIGIPENELDNVFDKFVQSSKSVIEGSGTGLGLSICKEIIIAHGGDIKAVNNIKGGTTFTFTIPC